MRVALFSRNVRCADAIGAQVVAKIAYFQQLGAEVRLYLSEAGDLRAEAAALKPVVSTAQQIWRDQREREYLLSADLVLVEYGAAYDLINLLPAIGGQGPKIVVDYRGVTPVELGDAGLQRELEAASRQRPLLWCADAVTVQSPFAARELEQSIGLPAERIHLMPCWIAPSQDGEIELAGRLRARHGLATKKIVLFVGRLAANKQPELLIRALKQLDESVQAVFVGCQSDAYRERLQVCTQLAHETGVGQRVHFIGSVSEAELAGWYRAADVLVLPSRHECFGMPVVEAMQRGVPVVGSDAGSLPEVIGHGGLTCGMEDASEFVEQIKRCLTPAQGAATKRVALVTHRFGTQFAGGAEKSLRLMAQALQSQGYEVEVFTTCNEHESKWANTLQGGTRVEDGFAVHRFAVDSYDAEKLGQAYQAIIRADGRVNSEVEETYLKNSLGSGQLIEALSARRDEFAAIITGPYLFKLVYEVACALREQVLLASCFHDEPLARLRCFQKVYRQVGGLLFHTESEAKFTALELAVNHPRHAVVGTMLNPSAFAGDARRGRAQVKSERYLVYCGRYCPEKGLDRVLEYMEELNRENGVLIKLVCLGQGPMKLPTRPWLVDAGFVSEETKRDIMAGAMALANLSRNESLSIVALEAWALGVPVIVDAGCAVLVDQVNKAAGGASLKNCDEFKEVVCHWLMQAEEAKAKGSEGKRFVEREYASAEQYALRLDAIVRSLQLPLREVARTAGMNHAVRFTPTAWQRRLSEILEHVSLPSRSMDIGIEPLQETLRYSAGSESGIITLRLCNRGTKVLAVAGPAGAHLVTKVLSKEGKVISRGKVKLPTALVPGEEQLIVASVELPKQPGAYRVSVNLMQNKQVISRKKLKLFVSAGEPPQQHYQSTHALGPMLQSARAALAQAKRIEQLPEDYVDVSEGKLAGLKRSLKRKLLNNFRKAYVDVAFRQQSLLNEKLIAVMSLMVETVSAQDTAQTLADMQRRLNTLERSLKRERRKTRRLAAQLQQLTSPDVSLMEGA